ncbi:uncharacterized protein LOC116260910 [Nymphaea colorata]|uniref:Nudix hydrolase domain-containing protein n=1 Tax=Nymphaea colorata TaxID=210225 RepID=A0A5K1GRY8_9MAGN|nr:uncharacterized protein LOC116260910 [Nymphaea colorata]
MSCTTTTSSSTNAFLTAQSFPSPQALSDWLRPRLPHDLPTWGVKPGTKNVSNLWLELSHGETVLQDTIPPRRTVNVATVNIRNLAGNVLIESHQELSDGSVRSRCRPLSEKMKAGETIREAAIRAVREELGSVLVSPDGVRVLMDSYSRKIEERDSGSYPGMPSCYILHSVDVIIKESLPEGDFSTQEEDEYAGSGGEVAKGAVVVRKHFWKWVPQQDA